MKTKILTAVLLLSGATAFAQGFHFDRVGNKVTTSTQQTVADKGTPVSDYAASMQNQGTGLRKYPMEFGGNLGLGFGSGNTTIQIQPTVGWQFNKYLTAGVGVNYIYHSYDYDRYDSYKENYLGLGVYARTRLFDYIGLYVRPEANYAWGSYKVSGTKYNLEKKIIPSLILGGGVYLPIGNGSMLVSVYYDVIQDDRSPYGDSVGFSVGYVFGL